MICDASFKTFNQLICINGINGILKVAIFKIERYLNIEKDNYFNELAAINFVVPTLNGSYWGSLYWR